MKRIYINISDIPTYVGKSKYDIQRPIERLWSKYDKDDDFPIFAFKVTQKIIEQPKENLGILICGSGIGMSIMANRTKAIRAGLCLTPYAAELGRKEDNINILVLAGDLTDQVIAQDIIERFLTTKYIPQESTSGELKCLMS